MTPFGLFMRKLRLEQGLLLKDMADSMGVSSAYLSALEHGKKGTPKPEFVSALEAKLKLSVAQKAELRDAVRNSATQVAIPSKVTPLAFETAHAFARMLPDLSERQLREMQRIFDDKDES